MNRQQVANTTRVWRGRKTRAASDRAYRLYEFGLLSLIVFAPIGYGLWQALTEPTGTAFLTDPKTPALLMPLSLGLWVGALALGRYRGPALHPPFLLHALSMSAIPRSVSLRRPFMNAVGTLAAVSAGAGAFVGAALLEVGATVSHVIGFVAATAVAGIIAGILWLVGQVYPRAAIPVGVGILALAAVSRHVPSLFPWGWVAATYPLGMAYVPSLVALVVCATGGLTGAPWLMNRLGGTHLLGQAAAWQRAVTTTYSFEFGDVAAVYTSRPSTGRGLRGVTGAPLALRFFLRDAIGTIRAPGRFITAVIGLAAAGVLAGSAFLPSGPAALPLVVATLVIFAATGAFTQGLQHAAHVSGTYPLYGVSDHVLVLLHTVFPAVTLTTVVSTSASVMALSTGASPWLAAGSGAMLALLNLAVRFSSMIKGHVPIGLLTPVSTPVGDLSIVSRLLWAFYEPLIAVLGGAAIALLPQNPWPVLLVVGVLAIGISVRWRKRR